MKSVKQKLKDQSGQSAVEFIMIILVIFFFLLFYLSLTFAMVVSSYLDYATFMAARTYKSAYSGQETQENYARRVFNAYFSKIQGIARNPEVQFERLDPQNEQSWGIRASYDVDLFYLPPVFIPGVDIPSVIRLESSSYLGREPGVQECESYFERFVQNLGVEGVAGSAFMGEMYDNGC